MSNLMEQKYVNSSKTVILVNSIPKVCFLPQKTSDFHEVLTELKEVLSKATFVSIDGEFTGLNSGDETTPYDTPAEYYRKIRNGAMDFLLVQFGLAVFHLDEETKQYIHRCYNFYIYPRHASPGYHDTMFLSDACSLDFLIKKKFNFNKLILEGIPYLDRLDIHEARQKLKETAQEEMSIPIPEEFSSVVTNALEQIAEFLHNKSSNEIAIKDCNRRVRKLIYQEAWKKFSRNDLSLETSDSGNIIAKRTTAAKRIEEAERIIEEDKKKLEMETKTLRKENVGFTKLIKLLSNADKLIVGHNMCLCICHILHRFSTPLPDSYEDFKELLHCLFPKIMDTMQLCCHPDVKDKVTSSIPIQLLEIIQKPPFHLPVVEPGFPDDEHGINEYEQHGAGYDAYITGLIYIGLTDYICTVNHPRPKSEVLKQSFNKLIMMKVHDTHINLEGPDPEVSREHVFHITYPKNWTYQDIN